MSETSLERRERLRITAALAEPKIVYARKSNRWVVDSLDLAACIGHTHYNVVAAAKKTLARWPDLEPEFIWSHYVGKTGRNHERVYFTRKALRPLFERLRPVPACRTPLSILERFVDLLKQREGGQTAEPAPAEPAPDSEIRPPDPEPPNLFDRPEPIENPAESWEINGAIRLLLKRSNLPGYLKTDIGTWNLSRCKTLAAKTDDHDAIRAIYAVKKPD